MTSQVSDSPNKRLNLILYAFVCFSWFSATLLLSVTDKLADSLNTSAANIHSAISVFFIMFAIAQILAGPISDSLGRKKIVLVALSIAVFGTLVCIFSSNFIMFIVGQAILGFACGPITVMNRAIASDYYDHICMAKLLSMASVVIFISPILSSGISLGLTSIFPWYSIFIFEMAFILTLLFVAMKLLPETLEKQHRTHVHISVIIQNYIFCLKNTKFILFALIFGATAAGVIAGVFALAPLIFIQHLSVPKSDYILLSACISIMFIVGAMITRKAIHHASAAKFLKIFGLFFLMVAGLLYLIVGYGVAYHHAWFLLLIICSFSFGCGMLTPLANATAMSSISACKGSAGALVALCASGLSSFISMLIAILHGDTFLLLAVVFLFVIILISILLLIERFKKQD